MSQQWDCFQKKNVWLQLMELSIPPNLLKQKKQMFNPMGIFFSCYFSFYIGIKNDYCNNLKDWWKVYHNKKKIYLYRSLHESKKRDIWRGKTDIGFCFQKWDSPSKQGTFRSFHCDAAVNNETFSCGVQLLTLPPPPTMLCHFYFYKTRLSCCRY